MKFTIRYTKLSKIKSSIFLRHRFSVAGKRKEVTIKTKFEINPEYWDDVNECWDIRLKIPSPRKAEDKALNYEIDKFNIEFGSFKISVEEYISKNRNLKFEDLKTFIFGEDIDDSEGEYPDNFSEFVDFYIAEKQKLIVGKQKPISERTKQKYELLQKQISKLFPKLKITKIDDKFRERYSEIMTGLDYKQSYIVKNLSIIKMFCRYANKKLDVNKEVLYWNFVNTDNDRYTEPIFSFEEINIIRKTKLNSTKLDNARDWLLISCYTGQRVSDLLKMDSENIVEGEFYNLFQEKGKKSITIWLMPEVIEILKKRGGEFPRKISSQKYNDYIKLVCFEAKMYDKIKGGKEIDKRKVIDFYPKWELITSHIGRRTFVSLFQSQLGKEHTMTQTGHTTERMVDLYNKTSPLDKARKVKAVFETNKKGVANKG